MKLSVDPQIFSDFDNPRIAVIIVRNIHNSVETRALNQEFAELSKNSQSEYGNSVVSQLPKIAAWREAYRTFGVKAKDYPSSVEALYKRVLKGADVSGINPLVDIYNYISLKYMLPVGGEDIDKMQGNLVLTYASANEIPVKVLGRAEEQAPAKGEVIYKDDLGTICRRWNWREVARTMLTENTQNCILVLEALNPTSNDELIEAQQALGRLVEEYCHAKAGYSLLTRTNPPFSF